MRSVLVLFVFLAGCLPTPANTFKLKGGGSTSVEVTLEPFSFLVVGASGEVLRSRSEVDGAYGRFAPTLDRPTFVTQIIPGHDDYQAGDGTWVHGGKVRLVERTPTRAVVEWDVEANVARLEISIDGDRVRVQTAVQGGDAGEPSVRYNKTSLAFALPEDEHFFGLGERFATFDHRGWSMYSWAEEGPLSAAEGVPAGLDNPFPHGPSMTYFPVPFFLSSRGYGLHVDTDFRSELHLGSEKTDGWRVAVNARRFAFTVYVHDDPLKTLDAFTADTGRPLIPAPWVFGPRRRSNQDSRVPDAGLEWQVMRDRKLPITAIDDAEHFLPALTHVGQEDKLREWTRTLHANGYKAMAYNNPYVAQNATKAEADFAFGKENGFFVKDPKGDPSIVFLISGKSLQVGMIDFTNEKATAWYRSLLQRTVDIGYDGWMHDFGEYVPRNARLADGRRGDEVHNPYTRMSAQAARDVLQAALPDNHLFFVRSGYTGTQAIVPAVWGGDAETSFDETQGIPSTIRSGLNLALVGVPYWGSDGTGFKCLKDSPRDKDVFVRWLQIEAVSPIMMEQDACSNPLNPGRTKWTLWSDEGTQDVYRRMAGLHTRLQPYFMVLAREAHQTGHPLMRPLFLRFPREPRSWRIDDTFFLGNALYAAPVMRRAQVSRQVWFPPGARYVAVDDFTVFAGDQEVTVPAPLERLPLFLVEGQLLPLLDPEVQTLAPATVPGIVTAASRADVLDVQVALGPTGEAKLELFDGTKLTARRVSGDSGRVGFSEQADQSQCEKCFAITTRPQLVQVRVTSERAASSSTRFEELELEVSGSTPRRVRWDVLRLP